MLQFLLLFVLQAHSVFANTEKVIFLAPKSLQIPVQHPTLDDLQLEALSPQHSSLRTHIGAEFPTNSSKYGKESWYLLHTLKEGQRYEVRICWAATQPTSFRLETYDLSTVFETPELITSLAMYSDARQPSTDRKPHTPSLTSSKPNHAPTGASSTLILQIYTAADYYTLNRTMMEHAPPVFVDIILDPYLFNIFPQSLLPTAAYIIILAIGGWYLAKYISAFIQSFEKLENDTEKKRV